MQTVAKKSNPWSSDAKTGRRLDDSHTYVFTAGPAASHAMRARYIPTTATPPDGATTA